MKKPQRISLAVATLFCLAASSALAVEKKAAAKAAPLVAPQVAIETNKGTFVIELYADKTPETAKNFLEYVDSKFYDGLIFHRVIDGFMVQGGGVTQDLRPKQVRAPIKLEAQRGLSNSRGTVAMARLPQPDSATSQFFVNLVDNKRLDSYGGGYAVFGKVVKGMKVVDAIAKVPTKPQRGHNNAPIEPVVIKSARVVRR